MNSRKFTLVLIISALFAGFGCERMCYGADPGDALVSSPAVSSLESKTFPEFPGSIVQSIAIPKGWKCIVHRGGLFDTDNLKVIIKELGGRSNLEFYIIQTYNHAHDSLFKFCNHGPRLIYSKSWQKEVSWTPDDQ